MARTEKKKVAVMRPRENTSVVAVISEAVSQVDELVEEAVRYINEIASSAIETGCQGTLEIGRYVLDKFYGNDPSRVHLRGPHKETSFRELENHPELQLSKSSLHNAVALAIQEHNLLEAGKGKVPESVSASHRVALLGIRPRDEQDRRAVVETARLKLRLMQEVAEKSLSVRQLQERIAAMGNKLIAAQSADRREKRDKSGPRLPKLIKSILAVPFDKIVRKELLSKMSPDDRRLYRNAIEKAVDRLTQMMEQIDAV